MYLLGGDTTLRDVLDGRVVHVSFVTELELLSYPSLTATERFHIEEFLDDCRIVDVNQKLKTATIEIRRRQELALPDALIAATSETLGVPLLTADNDFDVLAETISIVMYEP